MKILIIWPNIESNARHEVNMGICLISAILKKNGHQTSLFNPNIFSKKEFLSIINQRQPDLVGFSVTTHQFKYAIKYAKILKEAKNITTIFGGFHPTLSPESVISSPYADMVCRGEGEFATLELMNALEKQENYTKIPNLWVKKNGQIIKNDLRRLVEDLDSLPFPDREFINQKEILKNNGGRIDIAIGRGCPYNCPYCCNSALRKVYSNNGQFIRLRSVDNVLTELSNILKKYYVDEIHFQDDMFLLNKKWLREFADKYSTNFRIPFHISARIEHIDKEAVELLKKTNCISVTVGVESGNEHLRKTVLNKKTTNKEILKARSLLKKVGIKICSLNMIGVPEETPATIKETIDFNKKLDPDWLACSIFSPYPGTDLYKLCKENKFIKKDFAHFSSSYLDENSASILSLPTISEKEVITGYRQFMNFAIKKYIKEKYPFLFPFFIIISPLLKTPLRKYIIKIGTFLIFDKGIFKKKANNV